MGLGAGLGGLDWVWRDCCSCSCSFSDFGSGLGLDSSSSSGRGMGEIGTGDGGISVVAPQCTVFVGGDGCCCRG